MLNNLAAEHTACKKRIFAATAGISKERSTPDNPSFFVQCGDPSVPEVVRFTLSDIRSMSVPEAAKNIDRAKGLEICSKEAKIKAVIPSSVNFSTFFDVNYDPKPNGNTVISSTFTAKNAFNAKQKYRIFCYFNGKQELTDVSLKPFL